MIVDEAQRQGVNAALAVELAYQESNLDQSKRGAAGEIGIYQILPSTAAALGVDPTDLAQNIRGGILYLRQQLAAFGDTAKALAAYNCGPGCVSQAVQEFGGEWTKGIPSSTRSYISEIIGRLQTEYTMVPGVPNSTPTAVDWKRIAFLFGVGLLFYLVVDEWL